MKVLFWNTHHNKNINNILCELICENNISFVILAEYVAEINALTKELIKQGTYLGDYSKLCSGRITVLPLQQMNIFPGLQSDYYSFHIINNKDIYCCIHLPSKIYGNSSGTRNLITDRIVKDIESIEEEINSNHTIIVGDFNTNPFDYNCIDASGFHGIPILEVTEKEKRTIAGKEYRMFYNPMWRFFGDESFPYGTCYFANSDTDNIFWNIYDQVLIRPSLKDRFVSSSLRIITETKTQRLLNSKGHPNKNISDHLPIIFEIQEDE